MVSDVKAVITNEIPNVTAVVRMWYKNSSAEFTFERATLFNEKLTEDNALLMLYSALGEMLHYPEPLPTGMKPAPKKKAVRGKKDEG